MPIDLGGKPNEPLSPIAAAPGKAGDSSLILLSQIAVRMEYLESSIKSHMEPKPRVHWSFEIVKILFASWPAFGLVFIILFSAPLRSALNAIPEKVKGAHEIGILGISLKSTIEAGARSSGSPALAALVPKLSAAAVLQLLQGTKSYGTEIGSKEKHELNSKKMWFPSDDVLAALLELEASGLAEVDTQWGNQTTFGLNAAKNAISQYKELNPGSKAILSSDTYYIWTSLRQPVRDDLIIGWKQTQLGRQATSLIVKSIESQLALSSAHGAGGK